MWRKIRSGFKSGNNRAGELGLIIQDDRDSNPFKVRFRDGGTKWFSESEVRWCSASDMRAGSKADRKAVVALATAVGGVAHFAGEAELSTVMGFVASAAQTGLDSAVISHAQGAVIGAAADFAAEQLAAEGLTLTAAAILGAESGMVLGPVGMAAGAAGAVAAGVGAGALEVGAAAFEAGAAVGGALEVGAAVGAAVEAGAALATAVEVGAGVAAAAEAGAGLGAVGYAVASTVCIVQ